MICLGLYQREGDGIWYIRYGCDGRLIRESSKSADKKIAQRLLKQRQGEVAQGRTPGTFFDRTKFENLVDIITADYAANHRKSMSRLELSLKHLTKYFSGFPVVKINTAKVNEYIHWRKRGKAANGSINRELACLKRALNLARDNGKVGIVPKIPHLREDNVRQGFLELHEFLALRDALAEYLRPIATFGYKTGWRVAEITGLTWKQVDLFNGTVRLDPGTTKNNKGRMVHLDLELREMFEGLWENRKGNTSPLPYVFLNEHGSDRVKRFDKAWATACDKAGIGKKLFHDMRRSAVRNLVRSGVSERVAMSISGHRTRSVFDRYDIVSDADLKLAAQTQEVYLNEQKQRISDTRGDTVLVFPPKTDRMKECANS